MWGNEQDASLAEGGNCLTGSTDATAMFEGLDVVGRHTSGVGRVEVRGLSTSMLAWGYIPGNGADALLWRCDGCALALQEFVSDSALFPVC